MAREHKDYQSYVYHQHCQNQQDWSIDRWCRSLGISRLKLEHHPYFEDVVTLLMFDSWQEHMNQRDRDIWQHCWQWSYQKEFPLSGHHRKRLLNIIDGLEYRHQAYQKRELKRQHIQARLDRRQLAAV